MNAIKVSEVKKNFKTTLRCQKDSAADGSSYNRKITSRTLQRGEEQLDMTLEDAQGQRVNDRVWRRVDTEKARSSICAMAGPLAPTLF